MSLFDKVVWDIDLVFLYICKFLLDEFLQIFKSLSGIWKGYSFQDNLLLVNFTSSEPKGEPCDDAFADLFGEPNPIVVLKFSKQGTFDTCAFFKSL